VRPGTRPPGRQAEVVLSGHAIQVSALRRIVELLPMAQAAPLSFSRYFMSFATST
jgi:hypothetical protein